jgi:peptidoglycan/xylan/chitin deacetylase (PgdA/CDA1 family)
VTPAAAAGMGLLARSLTLLSPGEARLLVLIYHRVLAQPDPMLPREMSSDVFRWQMELIRDHAAPLSLEQGLRGLDEGRLPARAVAVTFDDGYADNATVAAPILTNCGIPATMFVSTGFLDGGRMWNDSVIEALRRMPAGPRDLTEFGAGIVEISGLASRTEVCRRIIVGIKHRPPPERASLVSKLVELADQALPDDLMMTSVQVRELAGQGFEIGCHTVSHPILKMLPAEQALAELLESRQTLREITGREIRFLAYPNGRPGEDYDAEHVAMAARLGFAAALSTRRGVCSPRSDRLQLPRFTPWDRRPVRFLARAALEFRNPA